MTNVLPTPVTCACCGRIIAARVTGAFACFVTESRCRACSRPRVHAA